MSSKISNTEKVVKEKHIKGEIYRPLAIAIALAFSGSLPSITQAASFTVTNTLDSGVGSLREAVQLANSLPGADIIDFSITTGSTIYLSSELNISDSVTITGPGAGDPGSIILDGGNANRHINAGGFPAYSGQSITLENITLTNGNSGSDEGGAVLVNNADLILNHSLISGNSADGAYAGGGGIAVRNGNATLTQSTISGNTVTGLYANGGGLLVSDGDATLNQSIISGNQAVGTNSFGGGLYVGSGNAILTQSIVSGNTVSGDYAQGGGLHVYIGNATLTQSTVSGNSSTGFEATAGGIFVYTGNAMFTQTTVSGNQALGTDSFGGAIYVFNSETIITQSTIFNNTAETGAGGISANLSIASKNITLINSILSGNTGTNGNFEDKATTPVSFLKVTYSLFGDSAVEITDPASSNNQFTNIPDLGPLQDNGGITYTHLPNLSSPAFNAGSNFDVPSATDQRGTGFARILHGLVDIGSVELSVASNQGDVVTRSEIVKPILQAVLGDAFVPAPATGSVYTDVSYADFNAAWVEEFEDRGFTEGCAVDRFCPNDVVTKEQLAKLIIIAKEGTGYTPMPATGIYTDVPIGSFNADWIEALNLGSMTTGCATGKYCPKDAVTVEVFENILNAAFP